MIQQFDVDGVPTVLAPTSGPMRAGLVFRVGQADETLARAGITHLVEHLALYPLGLADYHYNGSTGLSSTSFHTQGSAQDIAGFLTSVCDSLTNLPMQRLTVEKEILRTEAAGRSTGVSEPLARWRYGARDYGLLGYPEWGISAFTPDDLHTWVSTYFTRDNAVLWIAGDAVPPGLSLRLAPGVRRPVPAASSTLPVTPAYFPGAARVVAWDTVVPRSTPAMVFASALEREMFRSLRQESGLSYAVQTDYDPRGDGMAVITAVADALPDKLDAVLGGFIDVLAKLRVGRVEAADVQVIVSQGVEALQRPDAQAARLPGYAVGLLTGDRPRTAEHLVAELRAVTVDDVVRAAGDAMRGGLLMTPAGRRADWAGFAKAPSTSDTAVQGTTYSSLDDPAISLVVGAEGVSLVGGNENLTVRYATCAALLAWPDGARVLIGDDAISLRVEPTLAAGLVDALPVIDRGVPADRRVDLPPRDPDEIPRPEPRTAPVTGSRGGAIALLILLWPLQILFGGMSMLLTVSAISDSEERGIVIFLMIVSYALAGACMFGVVRAQRRLNRLPRTRAA